MKQKPTSKTAAGCLMLFFLPFLAVGLLTLSMYFYQVYRWIEMKSWVEVPTKILEAELVTNSSSDGSTFQTKAKYTYSFNGQSYTSDKVSLSIGSDNVSDFHKVLSSKLIKHRDSGEPLNCYVNPSNPSEAIIHRNLRVGMMLFLAVFGLIFTPIGGGLFIVTLTHNKGERADLELKENYPDKPWLYHKDWADKRIKNSRNKSFIALSLVTTLLVAIGLPLVFVILEELLAGGYWPIGFGLILPAVAIFAAYKLILELQSRRKFGALTLSLATLPIKRGERFTARVLVPGAGATSLKEVLFKLICTELKVTGSGDDRSTVSKVKCELENKGAMQPDGLGGGVVTVNFEIPATAPETSLFEPRKVTWMLKAKELKGEFELPVFG